MNANPAARLEREGGLATITLDSPPLNLFDQRMIDDLRAAIDAVAAEPPRALLIRAEGRAVSGGVDVHVFAGLNPKQASALWTELLEMIDKVEALPAPVVFAAHARKLAQELAAGPTKAHAMTKHILRRFREGGIPAADEAVRTEAGELFASEDLQNAVRTFLEQGGPGHATFEGR